MNEPLEIPVKMISIRVLSKENLFATAEVHPDIYTLLKEKVIKSVTSNLELQIFLQSANLTLDKLMHSCITETMLNEAINEL